jgi:plasmid stabilization system protein ParE
MEILWSDDAKQDYDENIEYLLREWSEDSASTFIEEVDLVLELLKTNPKLYPISDYKSIRRAVIRKQITLFYQDKGTSIYLVRFWNTYKDSQSLNL